MNAKIISCQILNLPIKRYLQYVGMLTTCLIVSHLKSWWLQQLIQEHHQWQELYYLQLSYSNYFNEFSPTCLQKWSENYPAHCCLPPCCNCAWCTGRTHCSLASLSSGGGRSCLGHVHITQEEQGKRGDAGVHLM